MTDLRQVVGDLLFPPLCCSCREFIRDRRALLICDSCRQAVEPLLAPLCPCCGRTFPDGAGQDHRCGRCITAPPAFAAARGAVVFSGTVRELIHCFKYGGKVSLRRPLALLAAEYLDGFVTAFRPELVIPVPLHSKRLSARGFNQAVLLGEPLARRWGVAMQRDNLRRSRWTEPQVNLSAAEREENVRGAFTLARPELVAGKRVLLVDDVYTTGSTVRECAMMLRKGGSAAVAVITIARAAE